MDNLRPGCANHLQVYLDDYADGLLSWFEVRSWLNAIFTKRDIL